MRSYSIPLGYPRYSYPMCSYSIPLGYPKYSYLMYSYSIPLGHPRYSYPMCSYSNPQSAPQFSFHSDQTCFYHILGTPIQCAPTISHINLFPCIPYSILNNLLPRRYFPNVHNLLLPFSAIITTSWMPSSSVQIPCCLFTSYILPDLPYCSFVPTPTINFPYSDYFPRTSFCIFGYIYIYTYSYIPILCTKLLMSAHH